MTPNKPAWRKIVEWINPVEWFSYVYGRFFYGHPLLGFVPVAIVVLLFTAVAWWRGVDSYNKEHPIIVESVIPSAALPVNPLPTSSADPTHKSPVPALSIERSEDISIRGSTAIGDGPHIAVQDSKDVTMEDILSIKPKDEKPLDRPH